MRWTGPARSRRLLRRSAELPVKSVTLDGEAGYLRDDGRPDFNRLRKVGGLHDARLHRVRSPRTRRAGSQRALPLYERRAKLKDLPHGSPGGPLVFRRTGGKKGAAPPCLPGGHRGDRLETAGHALQVRPLPLVAEDEATRSWLIIARRGHRPLHASTPVVAASRLARALLPCKVPDLRTVADRFSRTRTNRWRRNIARPANACGKPGLNGLHASPRPYS